MNVLADVALERRSGEARAERAITGAAGRSVSGREALRDLVT